LLLRGCEGESRDREPARTHARTHATRSEFRQVLIDTPCMGSSFVWIGSPRSLALRPWRTWVEHVVRSRRWKQYARTQRTQTAREHHAQLACSSIQAGINHWTVAVSSYCTGDMGAKRRLLCLCVCVHWHLRTCVGRGVYSSGCIDHLRGSKVSRVSAWQDHHKTLITTKSRRFDSMASYNDTGAGAHWTGHRGMESRNAVAGWG